MPTSPQSVLLSKIEAVAERYIKNIDLKYNKVYGDKYVIMLKSIHMIIIFGRQGDVGIAPYEL